MRIDENRQLRLPEHVDESRSDDHPFRIDALLGGGAGEMADRGDASVPNPDVAAVPWRPGSIDDVTVGDQDVEWAGPLRGRDSAERDERDATSENGTHAKDSAFQ